MKIEMEVAEDQALFLSGLSDAACDGMPHLKQMRDAVKAATPSPPEEPPPGWYTGVGRSERRRVVLLRRPLGEAGGGWESFGGWCYHWERIQGLYTDICPLSLEPSP
jgi:hypothetical protein